MQSIDTEHHFGIVFLSGGGILGAYTGGLQYEDILHNHRCPAVYLTTSAGFPVAAARAVAEYRIAQREQQIRRTLKPIERADIVRDCHIHLWQSLNRLGSLRAIRSQLYATVMEQHGAGIRRLRRVSPWLAMPFEMMGESGNMLHPLPWWLRSVFPEIDVALKHPRAPRIIANVYDEESGRMDLRDTHAGATLEQLVGTMAVRDHFPWVSGRYTDGGHTGFNGDYFHVLGDLIAENKLYATMPVTFVNLGRPDLEHDTANRMLAEQMQGIGRKHNLVREFRLNRALPWIKELDKLRLNPRIITKLFELGQSDYQEHQATTGTWPGPHRAADLYAAIQHLAPAPSKKAA